MRTSSGAVFATVICFFLPLPYALPVHKRKASPPPAGCQCTTSLLITPSSPLALISSPRTRRTPKIDRRLELFSQSFGDNKFETKSQDNEAEPCQTYRTVVEVIGFFDLLSPLEPGRRPMSLTSGPFFAGAANISQDATVLAHPPHPHRFVRFRNLVI